ERAAGLHAQVEHARDARIVNLARRGVLRLDRVDDCLALVLADAAQIDFLEGGLLPVIQIDGAEDLAGAALAERLQADEAALQRAAAADQVDRLRQVLEMLRA